MESTDLSFSDIIFLSLLELALLGALEVEFSQSSVVTVSGVVGITSLRKTVGTSLIGKSGEFFFFLLLLESTFLLFGFFEGFFLSTLELGLTNGLLNDFTSEVHLGNVHDDVTQNEQDKGTH